MGDLGMGLLGGVGNLGMGLLGGMGGGLGDMGMGMLLGGMMGSLSQSILPRTVGMPSFGSGMPSFGSGMPSFGSGMPSFGSGMSPFGSGMDASSASGTLASYMNQNGIKNLDTNDLYKLSQNTSGDVPPGVQNAAKYMLQNPDEYKQIETHDVAGAGGKCGDGNFEWAAQGGLGSNGGQMNAESASGALSSYMHQNGIKNLDTNDLYKLSQNTSGDVPQGVQNAAKYMLQNPDVYKQIETHDVAGADGKCGIGNFDWAAQGGLWGA